MALYRYFQGWPSRSSWTSCNCSIIIYCIRVLLGSLYYLIVKREDHIPSIRLNKGIDCKEGSSAWCGSLVPSLLPQRNLTSFDLILSKVLRADPLPTHAICPHCQPSNPLLRISLFSTIHEIITPRKICAIRYVSTQWI